MRNPYTPQFSYSITVNFRHIPGYYLGSCAERRAGSSPAFPTKPNHVLQLNSISLSISAVSHAR